jgi:hypothetical protein
MAKILTDKELFEIISSAYGEIDDKDQYEIFLKDLGDVICMHFGGDRGCVSYMDDGLGYTCAFHINETVPSDGGVFKKYDPDVVWKDGVETEKED